MRRLTYIDAIIEGIAEEMRRDPDVFLIGQDIGRFGGSLQGTKGLWEEFGPSRIYEAPIAESAMAGCGIGAALMGLRPMVEISFGEFLPTVMSQLVCHAASIHYGTAGVAHVPLVIRTRVGIGPYRGHPQCYESWFQHVPGLKVVMPYWPADAKGLIKAAIRDENPVLFFEHMFLYRGIRGEVPDGDHLVPIGRADIKRPGRDVTIAATGWMVLKALVAADLLAREGIEAEVVDLRTLAPLDVETLCASVRRTGRLVVVHEAWKVGGIGAEIAATVAEEAFEDLEAPIVRVGTPHVPIPSNETLRKVVIPDTPGIIAAVHQTLGRLSSG
ncbi:MAG: alpha-ketoacid dehydrogenase subunit beta [candidate division NC10 bacterium]|nr:alpha-ketoacid dehydrogenase subunit beta [candidate division NC10 bacterium]